MRYPIIVGCGVLLALGGCTNVDQSAESARTRAGLADALTGFARGERTSCLPITYRNASTKTFGPTLLYSTRSDELYRNDTAGGCDGAANGDALVSVEYEGRPCQGDIVRTIDLTSRIQTGSCSLGDFVRYRRVK